MKKYKSYKEANVEGFGVIPEEWEATKTKYFAELITSTSEDAVKIGLENIEGKTGRYIPTDTVFEGNGIAFKKNDIIYGKLRPYLQKVWKAEFDGNAVGDFFVYRSKNNSIPSFLKYLFLSEIFTSIANGSTYGAKMPRVSSEFIANTTWGLPSIEEQQQIAAFLDYKTGKIDSLVSLLSERIEDLKKYRQAVISETVTHGLDKSVKMKDSGVDWIGEIPENWSLVPLKYLINGGMKYGANESAESDNKNWPRYIRITDITNKGDLREDSFKSLSPEKANDYMLSYGDILFARSGATVGKTYLFKESYPACYAGYLIKVSCGDKILPEFLIRYTQSHSYDNWKDSVYIMSTIQNIGADKYSNLPVPVPAIEEQQSIIDYLNRKTKQIDDCIAATEQRIDDLQKYRTSLIYEAVTGQIDVRDWTPNKEKNSI